MDTSANLASLTSPQPGAGQQEWTPASTANGASTITSTTPEAGGTNTSDTSNGSTTDPNGANATITPGSLGSGQDGSGSSSGLSFIASPQQNDAGANASGSFGGDSGFDPAISAHGGPNFGSGGAASRGDFSPPTATGASSWHQHGGFGPGHPGFSPGYDQPGVPGYSIIVLS
jgi:hypothetical protein